MTTNTNAALPDAVRVPLDSLHADAGYLCARLLDKSLTREEIVTAIRSRIDAAKAALTTAAAVPVEQRLDDIEQYRMQMAGICTASIGYWKAGDSVHPDYDTPALREVAALYEKYDELFQRNSALADWVASRWRDEVANRPLINKSRRPLDDTWRQVLRHLGVDDEARLGPRHDDLLAAAPKAEPVPAAVAHIQQPYTLAEIKAKIASNDYSAELLLQHAMLLLEKPAAVEGQSDAEPLHITHGPLMRHAAALLRSRKPVLPDHESVAAELELAADGHPTPAGDPSPEWLEVAESAMRAAAPTSQAAPHLPERDATVPAEQQGLFRKFDVRRIDGTDRPGGKHHGCLYFVLDVDHDPCARAALTAYAVACEATHPALAADLRSKWGAVPATQASPQPAVQQGDASPTMPKNIEMMAINRYRPVPSGVLAYKVVGGDGNRSLFSGTKDECQIVARKLTEAFLDGAHVALAAHPAAPVAQGDGWLEAAVAWEVCASIHQQWAKGKDAVYSTRQADFQKHAEDARAKAKENTQ